MSTTPTPDVTPPKKEDSALQKITRATKPALIFGLGLHWVWLCAIFYSAFPSQVLTNPIFSYIDYPLGVTYIFFFIVVTFGMGAFSDRITFFIRRRKFQITVAITLSISTGMLFLSNQFLSIPLLLLAESINGLASGFLFLLWSESYRRRDPLAILTNSALSVIFGFIVFRLITYLMPLDIASIVFTIIPVIEFGFLYLALHGKMGITQPQQFIVTEHGTKVAAPGILEIPTFHKLKVQRGKFFIRIGIPFFFFGMVLSLLCNQVFRSATEPSYLSMAWGDFLITTILPCIVMFIMVVVFVVTNQSDNFRRYYRYIIPLVSIFFLLACFQWLNAVSNIFTSTSYLCLEFMLWMELCIISHRYRISPILVTGFGRGALAVGMLFISVIVSASTVFQSILDSSIVYTFMLVMLVVGYSLIPREKDIKAMAIIESADTGEHSLEDEKESSQSQQEGQTARTEKRFIARCERIANMYLLSPREVDVFFLLAKGRNTAYISSNLFISEGTVHTHMRHIYKKLDIHKQQELIDMIDAPQTDTSQQSKS